MGTTKQTMPGYRFCEYLLVLNPHDELQKKIMQARKEFQQKYQVKRGTGSRAFLSLVRFTQLEMMEEKIVDRLKAIAMGRSPIKVELKDYGSFPSHTIFINVVSKLPLRSLIRSVREVQRLLKMDKEHKPHFIDEPHFVIARNLVPWQYEKGWLEYSHRQFTGRFIADAMLLLKRREGEMAYQILSRFDFMNLPVEVKQGDLFG